MLDDLIHQMQAERRLTKGFRSDSRLRERVEVLGPTLTLDKLRRAIATRCLDRLARPWDEMVQWLVAYKKQHRHPRVSKDATVPWTALLFVDGPVALALFRSLGRSRQERATLERAALGTLRECPARGCLRRCGHADVKRAGVAETTNSRAQGGMENIRRPIPGHGTRPARERPHVRQSARATSSARM